MLLKASRQIATVARATTLIAFFVALPVEAGEPVVSAIGVVESVDCQSQTIKILGITFAANDADNAAAICGAVGSVGLRYVSASGTTKSSGSIVLSKLTTLSSGSYVPGATPVYLAGLISEARVNSGEIVLSGAIVSLPTVDAKSGSNVEILGTQPLLGGLILPTTVRVAESFGLDRAVSAADSSIGSGFSFTTNSSIGSGVRTNSSIGSGISKNSSIGSGLSTNSSIGSGITTNSSIGSGLSTNSSIGSGITTNSSIGSGLSTNSSIGSGFSTNSSIGSGLSTNSSIGSGFSTNSSIGSGVL
jgi:hypothetical protein